MIEGFLHHRAQERFILYVNSATSALISSGSRREIMPPAIRNAIYRGQLMPSLKAGVTPETGATRDARRRD